MFISAPFDIKDIFFRTVHAINYIIFEGKYFIYRSKLNKSHLSISFLKKKCKRAYKMKRFFCEKEQKAISPRQKTGAPPIFRTIAITFFPYSSFKGLSI